MQAINANSLTKGDFFQLFPCTQELVKTVLPKSALSALTLPPVDRDPVFTISTSFFDSFGTFAALVSFRVFTSELSK